MVIVDSSVWIDFLNHRETPQTLWLLNGHDGELIAITSLALTEVLQGIRDDRQFRRAQSHFSSLPVFDAASRKFAVQAAQNFRILRKRGVTVRSTIDCLIATFCIESELRLLHCDRDFNAFEEHLGLQVFRP